MTMFKGFVVSTFGLAVVAIAGCATTASEPMSEDVPAVEADGTEAVSITNGGWTITATSTGGWINRTSGANERAGGVCRLYRAHGAPNDCIWDSDCNLMGAPGELSEGAYGYCISGGDGGKCWWRPNEQVDYCQLYNGVMGNPLFKHYGTTTYPNKKHYMAAASDSPGPTFSGGTDVTSMIALGVVPGGCGQALPDASKCIREIGPISTYY